MRLGLRLGSAAVLLALVASALWVGGAYVDVLAGIAVCVAAWELAGLLRRVGTPPLPWLLYPLALWLLFRHHYPSDWPALDWGLGAATVVGLVGMLTRPRQALDRGFLRWAVSVGGALYLGLTLGYLLIVLGWHHGRFLPGSDMPIGPPRVHFFCLHFPGCFAPGDDHVGFWLVAIALGSAMVGDTAALFVGSAIGRRPFVRSISPNKSLEGALGSFAGTVLTWALAAPPLTGLAWYHAVLLGALVNVAAQGGDLVESALKRAARVKDASELIPGHGGLLDRLDSLLLIGPVVYAYVRLTGLP
jgi:CDP-diglyceride synthetase